MVMGYEVSGHAETNLHRALVKKVVFDKPLIAAPQSEIETWH
jgi:hypothetical protein